MPMPGARATGVTADLATLIHYVAQLPGIERIRFTTSHPLEVTPSLIEAFASVRQACKPPAPAGTERLGSDPRAHEARLHDARIQGEDPPVARGAPRPHRLLGFHHRLSRRDASAISRRRSIWCVTVGFDQSFSFIYSRRPGTPAAALPDEVPHEVKLERLDAPAGAARTAGERHQPEPWSAACSACSSMRPPRRIARSSAGRTANNRWVNFAGPAEPHAPLHRCRDHRCAAPHAARPPARRRGCRLNLRGCRTAASRLREFLLEPADNARLANLCGPLDENLRLLEVAPRCARSAAAAIISASAASAPAAPRRRCARSSTLPRPKR